MESSQKRAWFGALCWLLCAACQREPAAAKGAAIGPSASAAPSVSRESPAEAVARCPEFVPSPGWGHSAEPLTIALTAPVEQRAVELRSEGALLRFGFNEFLRAAECLNRPIVVNYLSSRPDSEQVVNISDQTDAQFVAPAAALLDLGHATVTATSNGKRADTVVKSYWIWMGCGGGCRHMGREYRLSIPGEVFFQITDAMAHGRRDSQGPSGTKTP
jgi:hypothetical protein